jgi:hypothetical protein
VKKILLMFMFLFFVCAFFVSNVDTLNAACCGQTNVQVGEWIPRLYGEMQCPNSSQMCMLRYRVCSATASCNYGACLGYTEYSCVTESGGEHVVYQTESCDQGDCVTTGWEEWQIQDTHSCSPYTCFDRCINTSVGMKETAEEDCDGTTQTECD